MFTSEITAETKEDSEFSTPTLTSPEADEIPELLPPPVFDGQIRILKRPCPTTPGKFS